MLNVCTGLPGQALLSKYEKSAMQMAIIFVPSVAGLVWPVGTLIHVRMSDLVPALVKFHLLVQEALIGS